MKKLITNQNELNEGDIVKGPSRSFTVNAIRIDGVSAKCESGVNWFISDIALKEKKYFKIS